MSQFLRYQNVLAKAHAHTVRSADLENLIVAVDLRNGEAARRNIDSERDATLRTRKAEFAAHIITPVEAAKIHLMNPQLSEQEILAPDKEDRGKQIDDILASGGVRHLCGPNCKAQNRESADGAARKARQPFAPPPTTCRRTSSAT